MKQKELLILNKLISGCSIRQTAFNFNNQLNHIHMTTITTKRIESGKTIMTTITTGSGGTWIKEKPIRTSMKITNPKLTGKFEDYEINGEIESMLEVDHDFGVDFIWEQFISQ